MDSHQPTHQEQGGIALVFPGGGSQYVGMGQDVCERYPAARRVLEAADAVLAFPLSQLCFAGPVEELTDTFNAQPAMVATSAALLAALQGRANGRLVPTFVAGHSTGQYTALLAAGALDLASVLRFVRDRGRLMNEAGDERSGTMAAVLGLDAAALQAVCDETGDVWIANDNAPGQIVLSGERQALERALRLAKQRGAKRAIPLAVNIASHCPLMAPAAERLAQIVESLPITQVSVPIVANSTALPLAKEQAIRQEVVKHLTSRVRWVESVRYMVAHGVNTFIEIGPKSVLSGLIRRIDGSVETICVSHATEIEAVLG
jgi:[acyl-carrier-protein] S-malonyltransferase